MSKIFYIDLTKKEILCEDYKIEDIEHYGRGLACNLLNKHICSNIDRLDEENVIVFTIGLFTGTTAPSSGRITLGTYKGKGLGFQIMNMTGSFPQKLASCGIEALVITGKSENNNTII